MRQLAPLLIACGAVTAVVWAATWAALRLLVRFRVWDTPNERSSHSVPKPRGGGWALIPVLLAAWLAAFSWIGGIPDSFWAIVVGCLLLLLISGLDDVKGLSAVTRLLVQGVAVALGLFALAEAGPVFQGYFPPLLDGLAAALLWLWFINLFNFMDGIDGISGVEAASIGLGLGAAAMLAGLSTALLVLPWLLSAAVLGFLWWNWEPSKIFLGDVGSVPLGYLLGWLLLLAAAEGQWAAALILPLYYLADATITLAARAWRRETLWRAHREHAYQRAVRGGLGHAQVSRRVALCNVALVVLALFAVQGHAWPALSGAAVAVAALLAALGARRGAP